jgi:hypothetical protein
MLLAANFTTTSVIGTIIYFAYLLAMPWYSRIDRHKPELSRLTG